MPTGERPHSGCGYWNSTSSSDDRRNRQGRDDIPGALRDRTWAENPFVAASGVGFEEVPLAFHPETLPNVIKSPSLYQYIDELMRTVHLDAVIVPVRDLNHAASGRMGVERDAGHRAVPWLVDTGVASDTWSWSPGGAVFSLDPVDQARLLAVGFYQLVERLVRADVPIIFLSFPRMVLDAAYLFRALGSVVPHGMTEAAALAAHSRVAVAAKIRIDAELGAPGQEYADSRALDVVAVRRQLQRRRASWRRCVPAGHGR